MRLRFIDEETVELEEGLTLKLSFHEVLEHNAMILLSLVKHAEIINFNIGNQDGITFDRMTLSEIYGNTLENISKDVSSLQNSMKTDAHKPS